MNFQNVKASLLIGQRNLDLTIHTARSQQSRVKLIRSVSRHDALNLTEVIKAVELVEKLHERTLNFTISRGTVIESLTTDSVDLINKDDARLVFFGESEHLSDSS